LAASKYTLKMAAMTARHSWQLALDNDVRLELGRDDRNGRLQRFIELYPVLQQQGQAESKRVSYVDLRYESGASVGWAPVLVDPQALGGQQNSNQQQNQAQAKQQ
jgi:cell division protein FtsQ